jgi:Tfp pilus assembly protein PilX
VSLRMKLRAQQGFTTVVLLGVLMVGGLMVTAGYAAVNPDIVFSHKDQDSKQAYGAAEAGLNYYLYHLGQDNNYYLKCANVPKPDPTKPDLAPVNLEWKAGSDQRVWRNVTDSKAQYTIELLPAKGKSACVEGDQASMIDPDTGMFRIRATGRVPQANGGTDDRRSIIASLRRKSFIDFLYFTNFETADPATYSSSSQQQWASDNCRKYRQSRSSSCTNIQFASGDVVNGPFHTNDDILTCDGATFGRTKNDAIEVSGADPGYKKVCSSTEPNFKGTLVHPGGTVLMPPSNLTLASAALPAYKFVGSTQITLAGDNMSVTNNNLVPKTQTMALPSNGVIWVSSSNCASDTYRRDQDYNAASTCGNVEVKGNYNQNLTIGAQNDIIVTDDITRNSPELLAGLIANNFVRVYHRVKNRDDNDPNACDNDDSVVTTPVPKPTNPKDINIQAAILAVNHSFIVDNWYCGVPLGTLTVDGAIAQQFRGPVGTGGANGVASGYVKNYQYNDRLRFREPPSFLDPVQSSWLVARQNEQIPAK